MKRNIILTVKDWILANNALSNLMRTRQMLLNGIDANQFVSVLTDVAMDLETISRKLKIEDWTYFQECYENKNLKETYSSYFISEDEAMHILKNYEDKETSVSLDNFLKYHNYITTKTIQILTVFGFKFK